MGWNVSLSASCMSQIYSALRALNELGSVRRTSALFQAESGLHLDLEFLSSRPEWLKAIRLPDGAVLRCANAQIQTGMQPVLASGERLMQLGRKTLVMGIINMTKDSFFDGGCYLTQEAAHQHALKLVQEGAAILDIGAESTRPGSDSTSLEDEVGRLVPFLALLRSDPRFHSTWLSVDTNKPEVAKSALKAGADMINDVSFGKAAREAQEVPYVLMHSRGSPKTMQQLTNYPGGVVADVATEMRAKIEEVKLWDFNLILDPGLGFAKTIPQNWDLVRDLPLLKCALPYPWLLGHSNKSFLRGLDHRTANLAVAGAAARASFDFLRMHSVADTVEFLKAADICYRTN